MFGGQRRRRSKVARLRVDRRSRESELLSPIPSFIEIRKYVHTGVGGWEKLSTRGEAAVVGGDERVTSPLVCASPAAPA
eukprot:COSAG06_NODE_51412_length_312_cov_0.967136_1_plen_78_part_01